MTTQRAHTKSKRKLADLLGVHRHTIDAYLKRGMPGLAHHGYHIEKCRQWMDANIQRTAEALGDDPELAAAIELGRDAAIHYLALHRQEQARALKRKNDLEEEQLVSAADVREALQAVGNVFNEKSAQIERTFGEEVGAAIRELVGDAELAWQGLIEPSVSEK